jgi:predicted transcriptional regulator
MVTCAFISDHKIDSYLKLQVLLLLHRLPQKSASLYELADQFFVGDVQALQRQVNELCQCGLLRCEARRCTLQDQPAIIYCLECLERTFDDPLARQRLLSQTIACRSPMVC